VAAAPSRPASKPAALPQPKLVRDEPAEEPPDDPKPEELTIFRAQNFGDFDESDIRLAPRFRRLKERPMSHQPPKASKKKPQHTPKEKKAIKQQKKHSGDAAPFVKH